MSESNDRVVLVTGGSRGIGRACAQGFAAAGAKVALCGRDAERATTTASEIAAETGATVRGYGADMADSESVKGLIASVESDLGPVHTLVNNAGIARDGLIMRMKNEDWDAVLAANLNGTFYACRAVARGMVKRRAGRIINISSVIGLHGQGGQSNYAASKAGIIGLTKSLAQELASRSVTANVVAPGYIDTNMTSSFTEAQRETVIGRIPMARPGSAQEVAAIVLFLASDAASYVTGAVIVVDGGLAM